MKLSEYGYDAQRPLSGKDQTSIKCAEKGSPCQPRRQRAGATVFRQLAALRIASAEPKRLERWRGGSRDAQALYRDL